MRVGLTLDRETPRKPQPSASLSGPLPPRDLVSGDALILEHHRNARLHCIDGLAVGGDERFLEALLHAAAINTYEPVALAVSIQHRERVLGETLYRHPAHRAYEDLEQAFVNRHRSPFPPPPTGVFVRS